MTKNKIKTISQLAHISLKLKRQNKKIVTTNGVFDILHLGHVKCLEAAKRLGDVLIVGVNTDASVKKIKGDKRPVNGEKSRIGVLAGLESVDYVFLFGEKDPRKWLGKIKPNVHAKAGDYKLNEIIEKDVVEKNGGKVALIPVLKGHSTTSLINKILKAENQ
ncbi:D-glycero-beta-D-manno-heptose 1-phosphate adenylyltransferase [Candidatus Woesearchaeota archaeon]|nr:D-glycero-beta-D-manno-heptose 1-phosphate adenylyltransferase [Candidatus Woesearchaeota archaeon]